MTTLYSWNVNGIRAARKKGFLAWLDRTAPDILAVQETKCHPDQLDEELREPAGYFSYWAYAEKKGYSGVALYSKQEPRQVTIGLGQAGAGYAIDKATAGLRASRRNIM